MPIIEVDDKTYKLFQSIKKQLSTDNGIIEETITFYILTTQIHKLKAKVAYLRKQIKEMKDAKKTS